MKPMEVKEAERLLQRHGIAEPPVPVEHIAVAEGVQIARNHFSGSESGCALRNGHARMIGVNTATGHRRQRFTIAHELGHLLLHEGKPIIVDHSVRINRRDGRSSLGTDHEEIQANSFAAELLMPREMVVRRVIASLDEGGVTRDQLIARLSREFDVSGEAIGYRLINLGILAAS